MSVNDMQELPAGTPRDKNAFGGTVRDVKKMGFSWHATWYDERNKNDRTLIIDIDRTSSVMTIVETAGGGNSPTQKWVGRYEANGNVYTMEGKLVEENNHSPAKPFDVYVTDLTLP